MEHQRLTLFNPWIPEAGFRRAEPVGGAVNQFRFLSVGALGLEPLRSSALHQPDAPAAPLVPGKFLSPAPLASKPPELKASLAAA